MDFAECGSWEVIMSYASIMVAVDDGLHAPARVRLAAELAHRLGARLVGAAACMPDYPRGYGETAVPMGMVIEEIRQAALDRLAGVEQVFRHASLLGLQIMGLSLAVLAAALFEATGLWFTQRFSAGEAKLLLGALVIAAWRPGPRSRRSAACAGCSRCSPPSPSTYAAASSTRPMHRVCGASCASSPGAGTRWSPTRWSSA
jgi:hypothetical protein